MAHGSGSGRFSPRDQFVARILKEADLATLVLDLLDEEEADDRCKVFDIDLLALRLQQAVNWLSREPRTRDLPLGYSGASTAAAAALVAAARCPDNVAAIVSRGGRPDLAYDEIAQVQAPTLFLVGGHDVDVIDSNKRAYEQLRCPKELIVIPGASHLFREPGALDRVAMLAKSWFVRHFESAAPNEIIRNKIALVAPS
jgi:putative phosphoribosyl transferase